MTDDILPERFLFTLEDLNQSNNHQQLFPVVCEECGRIFFATHSQIKEALKNNPRRTVQYCSRSCITKHKNRTMIQGKNRSHLEKFISDNLPSRYPELEFLFNRWDIIGGDELDIYIPALKLAIELNGRFHYENVLNNAEGRIRLERAIRTDLRKRKKCRERGITFYEIDTRSMTTYSTKKARYFLNMVSDLIEARLKYAQQKA